MRTSLGQKMQRPGQGNGFVRTVTGATPLIVRTGFILSFRTMASALVPSALARCRAPRIRSLENVRQASLGGASRWREAIAHRYVEARALP